MISKIKDNLKELGFHDNEIKVYVALTKLGEATAAEVAKKAELPRTTAISILNKLAAENYSTTHKHRGVTYYWIESPQSIMTALEAKMLVAKDLNGLLSDIYGSEAHFPFAEVLDTKAGIRKFIEKMLSNLKKKTLIYTIDSPHKGNYTKIYPENIENMFVRIKKDKGIITNTLIPFGTFNSIDKHKIHSQSIIIKEMPKEINFESSIWLVGDLFVHFSGNPPFVTAIKHEMIVKSMKSVYDFLWNMSVLKK